MPISLVAPSAAAIDGESCVDQDPSAPDAKTLVLPRRVLSGAFLLRAACILLRRRGTGTPEVRRASKDEASRAVVGSMARYRGAGDAYAQMRRGAWELACGLIDCVPTVVLTCDLAVDEARRVDELVMSLKGAYHGRQCVAD
jgi:hypothetical protein